MRMLKKIVYSFFAWSLMATNIVLANENVKKASIVNDGEVYLKAFYAAFATLLVILVIWLIIFKPRFNGSDHKS